MKIILVSHGDFSKEILKTAKMIVGDIEGEIDTLSLCIGDDINEFYEQIKMKVIGCKEPILVFADLLGGSPFLLSSKVYNELHLNEERFRVITGLNLPMLLEVLANYENSSFDELCEIAIYAGKNGIHDFLKERGHKDENCIIQN